MVPCTVSLVPEPLEGMSVASAEATVGRLVAADNLGEAPVDDEGLAVRAEHDVRRFEIAMDHTSAVRIGHGIAHDEESGEQMAHGQHPLAVGSPRRGFGLAVSFDSLLEGLAAARIALHRRVGRPRWCPGRRRGRLRDARACQ